MAEAPGVRGDVLTRRAVLLRGAALVLVVLLAYLPVEDAGFVWDDDDYVVDNPTLRDGAGLARIWLDLHATPQYYPLVHTSFWLEYQLVGASAPLYHLVNVILHAANALLLARLLTLLSVPGAWLVAAAFALHPMQVESVAWITERKNVLSGLFYLAAAIAYVRFALPGAGEAPRWRRYVLAWLAFLAALLSKTVTATLPCALAVVLWWRRGTLDRRDLLTLAPMVAVGAAFGLVTAWLERTHVGASGPEWDLSPLDRVLVAGRALWFYLEKLLAPVDVAFIYPRWTIDAGEPAQYAYPIAFAALLLALFAARERIGRGPLAGMLLFAGTLFPALGFLDHYPMRYSFVANHFQYLACIGPLALVVGGAARALDRASAAPAVRRGLGALLVAGLATLTWRETHAYLDLETLWRDTLGKNPRAWLAHNNLGVELDRQGRHHEAGLHYRAALRLWPDYARAHHNLARNLVRHGRLDDAMEHLEAAVALDPGTPAYRGSLGEAYLRASDFARAEAALAPLLEQAPSSARLHLMLASALRGQGRTDEARAHVAEALRLRPDSAAASEMLRELDGDERTEARSAPTR